MPAIKNKKNIKTTIPLIGPRLISSEENLPDGELILYLIIYGQPATKKNSLRVTKFRRVLPSVQYCKYEAQCQTFCENAWINTGKQSMDYGVSINMKVYLKNWQVGDATGYMQAIGDIIQKFGIITNDSWLHWDNEGEHWFGGVDKNNPRVEIAIKRFRHTKEIYRAAQEQEVIAKADRMTLRK